MKIGNYDRDVGYLIYYSSWFDDPYNRDRLLAGLVGGVGGILLLLVVGLLIFRRRRNRRKKKQRQSQPRQENYYSGISIFFKS